MREIKFRGWHIPKQKMFSAEEMTEDQLTLLTTGKFINVHGSNTRLSEIYPNDVFIPLQFTGLLDKNGKEIYEGDIMSDKGAPWNRANEEHLVTVSWESSGCWSPLYGMNMAGYKVIGNICENPELER